ncbi:MAG: hypothetical protein ACYDD9_10590 [Acidithiobacillus sp.]
MHCPQCHSEQVEQARGGHRIGTVFGAGLGFWGAFAAGSCAGGESGSLVATLAGPAGTLVGGCAGALLGGITAATTAALAGSKLGDLIDTHVLNDGHCLRCGYRFQSSMG